MSSVQQLYNNLLIKKIQGAPFTDIDKSAVAEGQFGSSQFKVQSSNIMSQVIPPVAPIKSTSPIILSNNSGTKYSTSTSYIFYYDNVSLTYNGVNFQKSFRYSETLLEDITTNILINTIPFNQDPLGSYAITVKINGTTIPQDDYNYPWYFDSASGYLTFFNNVANIPTISFWRYEGNFGAGSGSGGSSNDWNSQELGITDFSKNYYLLATMSDFSNNDSYGSINIKGCLGGRNSTDFMTIDSTIITSGNVANPTVSGSINSYSQQDSSFCDIVVYYNYIPTLTNIIPSSIITTVTGYIFDSSSIFYNSSNTNIKSNQYIGTGSNYPIVNSVDNTTFKITTFTELTVPSPSYSYTGFVLDSSNIIIPNVLGLFNGTFFKSSAVSVYNKPFIKNISSNKLTTDSTLSVVTPAIITGYVKTATTFVTNNLIANGFFLYSSSVLNAPSLTSTGTKSLYTLSSNQTPTTTSSINGYFENMSSFVCPPTTTAITMTNYFIYPGKYNNVDISNNTIVNNVTSISIMSTLSFTSLGENTTSGSISKYDLTGAIYQHGGVGSYYFGYKGTNNDPYINEYLTSSSNDKSYGIKTNVKGSGNFYQLTNVKNPILSTSRYTINISGNPYTSTSKIPYYRITDTEIIVPLGVTGDPIAGTSTDFVSFGGTSNDGNIMYNTQTKSATQHKIIFSGGTVYNNINLTYIKVFPTVGTFTTINFNAGESTAIQQGDFISFGTGNYLNSSIYVISTTGINNATFSQSITTTASTFITFYRPYLFYFNIFLTSSFAAYTPVDISYVVPVTYSLYTPVTFNFYTPTTFSFYNISDASYGISSSQIYSIYLLTNSNSTYTKGYFNLSITGSSSQNDSFPKVLTPSTDAIINPPGDPIVPSLCGTLNSLNNSFQTIFNPLTDITAGTIVVHTNMTTITTVSGVYNTSISTGTTGSLKVTSSNLDVGSTFQVSFTCYADYNAFQRNMYFAYISNGTILYKSPKLALTSTTYTATITIPIGDILYINFVSSGTPDIIETIYYTNFTVRRMDVFTNSYVGIGKSVPVTALDVSGTTTSTSFNALSDYRMKKNIQPLIRTIDNLKPIEYDFLNGKQDMGFLAHEVQEIFPFLVNGEKDGQNMQSINYNGFIALLVKEVQELKSTVKTLQNRIEILESK